MTYAQYGLIEATDFNNLVGNSTSTDSGKLNTVWGPSTGGTNTGYGQTVVPTVSVGAVVAAADWANLVNKTSNSASHQGTSITSVAAPVTGGTVTYISSIPTNLTTIYTNRLNAVSQSSTTSNTATYASTWSNQLTFTHTATFANANAARYFFNAGGQISIQCSHGNVFNAINLLFNRLASNIGTVYLSSTTSSAITIAGTSYNGITKIGGGTPAPTTLDSNKGFYSLNTTPQVVFKQFSDGTAAPSYVNSFIQIAISTNGTPGSVLTFTTTWDEVPNGFTVATGSATTCQIRPPAITHIANTWGSITLSGTVTGS